MNELEQKQEEMLDIWFEEMWKPEHWLCSASIMKQAADILFACCEAKDSAGNLKKPECINMDKPATLLYGYAMENVIKALVIKRKPLKSSDFKKCSAWHGHKLAPLLTWIEVELDGGERFLLNTLTAHINWAGKYPAAFEKEDFLISGPCPDRNSGGDKDSIPETLDKLKRSKLELLFKRIWNECKDDKS
jgi:hypothetical protein